MGGLLDMIDSRPDGTFFMEFDEHQTQEEEEEEVTAGRTGSLLSISRSMLMCGNFQIILNDPS